MHHTYTNMPSWLGWELGIKLLIVVAGATVLVIAVLGLLSWVANLGRERASREAQDDEPRDRTHKVRASTRLQWSAAFERLTPEEVQPIHDQAPALVKRLQRAVRLLAEGETQQCLDLLFVCRGVVRQAFGTGKHWLEAIIISDIAALHHHLNDAENADYHFAKAVEVGTLWFKQYPWLQPMCSKQRLIRKVTKQ